MPGYTSLALLCAVTCVFLASSARCAEADKAPDLVPWPGSVRLARGVMPLGKSARIVAGSAELAPLADVLAEEIHAATGLDLKTTRGTGRPGDVVLRTSADLKGEAYSLTIGETATVQGANYAAVALGTTTLVQLIRTGPTGAVLRRGVISDAPASSYRGLLIDVARKYHSIDTLRQCVRLCQLYKIRYLQLHLTDDPAFTFPSTAFPKLTSKNYHGGPAYTLPELRGLERYATERGVTIVPELEVPGHAGAMNRTMGELFKIKGTKPYEHHASINYANGDVIKAVDTLVGEICDVFRATPYFHIGGDEADVAFAHQHPEFKAAFKKYALGAKGQWQLYRHFLIQMNKIVRKRGKRMIVWEGFHRDPRSQFQIPKDVIVMEYECPFYRPAHLIEDGYTVINACWTPLYVVNRKRWTPGQIYAWDLQLFGQHTGTYSRTTWHRVKPTPQIIGAQMCSWEQSEAVEISSLRTRLPAMAERIWNPAAKRPYADFARRAAATDRLLGRLMPTVRFEPVGLGKPDDDTHDVPTFDRRVTVTIRSDRPADRIRYTVDGSAPTSGLPEGGIGKATPRRGGTCMTYTGPIVLSKTTTVRAAAFDARGKPVGHPTGEVFYLVKPSPKPPAPK